MNEEKIMTQKLQGKFSRFLNNLSKEITKPEQKFLKEAVFGILSSQSCIVRRLAQTLNETVSCKKTQERLIYHLDKENLDKKVSQKFLQQECKKLVPTSLIIVDPSDVVKKHAKKMEGLSKVRDGNDGVWKTGYDAIDIVGVNKDNGELSIFPMHSQLHSNTIELDTLKNKIFDRIEDIVVYSNNTGTFVFDRGFDDKKIIKMLHEHAASYIIRMKSNRNVFSNNIEQNILKVVNATKLKTKFNSAKGVKISAGITPIKIQLNTHPVKNPTFAEMSLVVIQLKSKDSYGKVRKGKVFFITNVSEEEINHQNLAQYVSESYVIRWKIEEVHRQVKTDFGWEDMQLLTYRRLQFLNTLLWVAMSFLYQLDKWKHKLAKVFTSIMLERKSKLSELNKFIYYRLAIVVKICFNRVGLYNKTEHRKRIEQQNQLMVSFL